MASRVSLESSISPLARARLMSAWISANCDCWQLLRAASNPRDARPAVTKSEPLARCRFRQVLQVLVAIPCMHSSIDSEVRASLAATSDAMWRRCWVEIRSFALKWATVVI